MSGGVLYPLVSGMLAAAYATAGLFFLRFWRRTNDRLFMMFALAFFVLAGQRVASVVAMQWTENILWVYVLRLIAFLLILAAIIDKNRSPAR